MNDRSGFLCGYSSFAAPPGGVSGRASLRCMGKRLIMLFALLLLGSAGLIMQLLVIATEPDYVNAAANQSTYRVSVNRTRGRIYDCRMRPLAGGRTVYKAVIMPSAETIMHLTRLMPPEELSKLDSGLTGRHPFVCVVEDAAVEGEGVTVFKTEGRYSANSVAHHLVGYLNGEGEGVAGIERAYNVCLEAASGELTETFTIDATGAGLSGMQPEIMDTTSASKAGVVLTVDTDLQLIAEKAAREYIERGAVVVMDTQGRIRASVSMPDFEQDSVGEYLEADGSPLLNRAIQPYDIGSVFKLVVAAAALEAGTSPEESFVCEGQLQVGDNIFHCSARDGHGALDMQEAIACSCNCYFINLAQLLGGECILKMAEKLGLGENLALAQEYNTAAGCLPGLQELAQPAALANFSFGQGKLMATPVHMASVVCAISNGGVKYDPTVFEAFADTAGSLSGQEERQGTRVMSELTAELLRSSMTAAVEHGTAVAGRPTGITAAAKTGSAQTGIIRAGHSVVQTWYAGFFPAENPQYVCVALVEDGVSGGTSAGPVFKYISENMVEQGYIDR